MIYEQKNVIYDIEILIKLLLNAQIRLGAEN